MFDIAKSGGIAGGFQWDPKPRFALGERPLAPVDFAIVQQVEDEVHELRAILRGQCALQRRKARFAFGVECDDLVVMDAIGQATDRPGDRGGEAFRPVEFA